MLKIGEVLPMSKYSRTGHDSSRCVLIEVDCGAILGYNGAMLLKGLIEYQSLERMAELIGISPEHARELIDTMNDSSSKLLVETSEASPVGERLTVTAEGKKALESFWKLYRDFKLSLCGRAREEKTQSLSLQCACK